MPDDMPIPENIHVSSNARMLLENMAPSRSRVAVSRTVSIEQVERWIDRFLSVRTGDEMNAIRDRARELAREWSMGDRFERLDEIMGAAMGTREGSRVRSPEISARSRGMAFDKTRVDMFEALAEDLAPRVFPHRPFLEDGNAWTNAAFFDAYFSNHIEGTRFLVEEAERIVFKGEMIANRTKDSHDILATYRIVSGRNDMGVVPQDFADFERILRSRHLGMMRAREEVDPGQYKTRWNRAGGTTFVAPDRVRGTLEKGFRVYRRLGDPFARAVFMMTMVSEVHPFADGNGRVARMMMNAELVSSGQTRILIPIVFREDYLFALRDFSRNGQMGTVTRVLERAWTFSDAIDFSNFSDAEAALARCNAFLDHSEGKLVMPSEISSGMGYHP